MPSLQFGFNIDPGARVTGLALDLARKADALGLDLIGIQDHPYIGNYLDTWTLLTYLGARTERVGLLTNVADLPLRPAPMLAKAAASLDILTEGRVILGMGAGARWDAIAGLGGPRRTPGEAVEATAEAIQVMRAVWGGRGTEPVTVPGKHYHLESAEPGPIPPMPIPIWIGAYGRRMLRLIGRLADGWTPTEPYVSPEKIPEMQRIIDDAARDAGRDPSAIRRSYNVMGHIQTGASRMRPRNAGVHFVPASEWVAMLSRYVTELGMDSFVYWPVAGSEREQLRLFAEDVIPGVRENAG